MSTGCKFKHTYVEMQIMGRKKRQDKKANVEKTTVNKPKPNVTTNKFTPQSKPETDKRIPKCERGKTCKYWQTGTCRYFHNKRNMKCRFCNGFGHPEHKCYSKKNNAKGNSNVPKYNPAHRMNAENSWKEIKATNRALVHQLHLYQQQYPDFQPSTPLPPSASQQSSTTSKDDLSEFQAFVMMKDAKKRYKEEQQSIRNRLHPRNSGY